ncbi:MAG TPA: P1 family peptidase [Terriglobia bacterium]|nr:P1 family peptidase [Terriglobia bacterium]
MPEKSTLPGIRIGHASDFKGLTGCTVILCEGGAVCGVDIRGSAAGVRDTLVCEPGHLVECIQAILFTGGSAFGLEAAGGVMEYLESRGAGFAAGSHRIPIVPAAVIYDLGVGSAKARPNAGMARWACQNATRKVTEGSIGAGTGAAVGKLLGMPQAMKAGVGFESLSFSKGLLVQALAVVNALGDVVDPENGQVIAGARKSPNSSEYAGTTLQMLQGRTRKEFGGSNTTLVAVMTNAALNKVQAAKMAQMAQDGMARAVRPVHTLFDGDAVFALSAGQKRADLNVLGVAAAEVTAQAIVRAVKTARSLGGVPALNDLPQSTS